jgi:hypothetical protein
VKNAPLPAKKKYKKEEEHTSMIVTAASGKVTWPTAAGNVFRVKRDASSSLDKDSSCADGNLQYRALASPVPSRQFSKRIADTSGPKPGKLLSLKTSPSSITNNMWRED